MGFKMPHVLVLVATACAGLGLLLQIVGVATKGWVTSDYGGSGIFEQTGTVSDALGAIRAFGIIGLLLLAGCAAVGALIFFMDNAKLPLIAAALGFAAGVCCLIEFAVFAGEMSPLPDDVNYGYSFGLTIVACILAVAAGACFFLGVKKNRLNN